MGRLASLYLESKAKSVLKNQWLWHPIAALPQPLLPTKDLTVAARATTTFLRLIVEGQPGNFMVHSVNQWQSGSTSYPCGWAVSSVWVRDPPPPLPSGPT